MSIKTLAALAGLACGVLAGIRGAAAQQAPAAPATPQAPTPQPSGGAPGAAAPSPIPPSGMTEGVFAPGATPTRVVDGFSFTEGPVWTPQGTLLFTDIPGNAVVEWAPGEQGTKNRVKPSGWANGLAFDPKGRLVMAQHAGKVSRIEADGKETVLAERVGGMRLNSPNDVVVHQGGAVFFTDPPYGLRPPLGPEERRSELGYNGVFRISPDGGEPEIIARDLKRPNGIALSEDGRTLYVGDLGTGRVFAYPLDEAGRVVGERRLHAEGAMGADGLKLDVQGRLFVAFRGGVAVYSPEGKWLGRMAFGGGAGGGGATNVCFGGPEGKTLFVTTGGGREVWSIETTARGARVLGVKKAEN